MPCTHCKTSNSNPHWGGYNTRCAHCCARLILSARPIKAMQDAMFAAINMRAENPTREAVLLALKDLDAHSARQSKASLTASNMSPRAGPK